MFEFLQFGGGNKSSFFAITEFVTVGQLLVMKFLGENPSFLPTAHHVEVRSKQKFTIMHLSQQFTILGLEHRSNAQCPSLPAPKQVIKCVLPFKIYIMNQ